MLSIMHRCYSPGGQLRYCFVMEGEQNIGKTEFCRRLVPTFWHTSQSIPAAADSPVEFYRATYDKAIVEIPEQGNLNKRNDQDLWKRIVTERYSTFRRMRADDVKDYPKRNIFIVTTNEYLYLRDHSGETRFLPIKSNNKQNQFFDLDGFSAELPQIYAQYREMYASGARPYLTQEELASQKDVTEERDLSKELLEYQIIDHYMNTSNGGISNLDVSKQDGMWLDKLYDFLCNDPYRMSRDKAMMRSRSFGSALVKFGFVRIKKAVHIPNVGTKKVYVWPETELHKRYG
jgi:predicted P-loop ATPase